MTPTSVNDGSVVVRCPAVRSNGIVCAAAILRVRDGLHIEVREANDGSDGDATHRCRRCRTVLALDIEAA